MLKKKDSGKLKTNKHNSADLPQEISERSENEILVYQNLREANRKKRRRRKRRIMAALIVYVRNASRGGNGHV